MPIAPLQCGAIDVCFSALPGPKGELQKMRPSGSCVRRQRPGEAAPIKLSYFQSTAAAALTANAVYGSVQA